MKNISFQRFPFLGLILTGVSVLTSAITPSEERSNVAVRLDGDGVSRFSTIGGVPNVNVPETVTTGINGLRSHTSTGLPCDEGDGLSATSNDDDDCTDTREIPNFTANATTATANDI